MARNNPRTFSGVSGTTKTVENLVLYLLLVSKIEMIKVQSQYSSMIPVVLCERR